MIRAEKELWSQKQVSEWREEGAVSQGIPVAPGSQRRQGNQSSPETSRRNQPCQYPELEEDILFQAATLWEFVRQPKERHCTSLTAAFPFCPPTPPPPPAAAHLPGSRPFWMPLQAAQGSGPSSAPDSGFFLFSQLPFSLFLFPFSKYNPPGLFFQPDVQSSFSLFCFFLMEETD